MMNWYDKLQYNKCEVFQPYNLYLTFDLETCQSIQVLTFDYLCWLVIL